MVMRCLRRPSSGTRGNDAGRDSGFFSYAASMTPLFTSILDGFNSKDPIARGEAIKWMTENQTPVTRSFLAGILCGSDRQEAVRTIFLLVKGGAGSLSAILDGLGAPCPDIRSMCIRTVSSLLPEDPTLESSVGVVVPPLVDALSDAHAPVREEAKSLLIRLASVSPDSVLANIDPVHPQAQVAIELVLETVGTVKVFS